MNDTQKIENSLGSKIDSLYSFREQRLAAQKQVDELKRKEKELTDEIMKSLQDADINKAAGRVATFSINETVVPKLVDYKALSEYIISTGHVHLLGRRVAAPAFRELLEFGQNVPGVEPYTLSKPSLTRSTK